MAFTFQVNNDVEFNHDKYLLAKADENTPGLYHEVKIPTQIVSTTNDTSQLDGVGIQKIADISELPNMELGRDDKVILDFGNHFVGRFSTNIKSVGSPMDAPLTLKIKFAELPTELNQHSEDYQGWLSKSWMQEELIHIDELPTKLDLARRYSFRYVEISVIDTSPKWKVIFDNPTIITESSVDIANWKMSDLQLKDVQLDKIYQVGVKTLADCMQNVFEDGPKRDRRLWIGDLRLQALSNYATFSDLTLVKRCMYLFGGMAAKDGRIPANVFVKPEYTPDDTFLLDYSLFFIGILDNYMQQTKDTAVLTDLYPVAKRQMEYLINHFINSDGSVKFDEDYPVFIDWSNDFDKDTAGVAIIIYSIKQFINLMELQHDADLKQYQSVLLKIVAYAKKELFDTETGFFVSGTDKEINIASQVWMVLANILDKNENQQLMQRTVHDLFPIKGIATPYMYHHITEALFEADMTDEAVSLLKSYWGKMVDLGADTFWEAFNPDDPSYSPYGSSMVNSYCHAWSCTPVYLIKKYLNQ
jgi:alpha-L-rhamnosidase